MTQCSKMIWKDNWRTGQCSRSATVTVDGQPYCSIHNPEYVEQKRAASKTKYEADNCKKCGSHFYHSFEIYCWACGTKRVKSTH